MGRVTTTQQNFSAGELSNQLAGRYDLNVYGNGGEWVQNFIATVQGMARFRSGGKFVWNTRDNQDAILVPFEYNTEQAYILEFTDSCMRVIKDGGLVLNASQAITAITKANPAVVTYSGADSFTNGMRIVINGVVGMTQVNNQEFIVANVNTGANTFQLQGINSTAYTTYSSGGTVASIVEVVTPFTVGQLFEFDYAQTSDTMYIAHPTYAPYKLTRASHTSWTLATYLISANPFGTTMAATKTITGITQANPAVVTSAAHGYANGDTVFISGVVGMSQVNLGNFTVANAATNTFQLQDTDSSSFVAYTSGGTAQKYTAFSYPSVVSFFEQRLLFAASDTYQQRFWGSRAGSYDIFVLGTGDSDAFVYNIASGKVDRIRWMIGSESFLAIGTAGAEFKAQGGSLGDPITPTNISVTSPTYYGSASVKPIRLDDRILYLQRDQMTVRSFEYDAILNGYTSINRNLTSDQITRGRYGRPNGLKQMAYQAGFPNITWSIRNDGILVGMTFEPREQVNGWHRHYAGGTYAAGKNSRPEYGSIATIPQDQNPDQVYYTVKRTINGVTKNYIEYFSDQPNIPKFLDYYTGDKVADTQAYLQDLWEAQKRLFFVDSGIIYDGSDFSTQNLTLSAITTGTGRTITADGAIFDTLGGAALVGREIWGMAGGRAQITGYTNSTHVTVKITVAFPSTAMAIGNWYLTDSVFGGAQHLAGQISVVLADGGVIENQLVDANGQIDLQSQRSYVIIGLSYLGIYKSMDLEGGGNNGPSQTKKKSISQLGVKLLETLGALFGTDIYKLDRIKSRSTADKTSRPAPLFSGIDIVDIRDEWSEEKHIFCVHDRPLPCNLQLYSPYMSTNDS